MKPAIGDMVHFRSVCAACNKVGRRHFTFFIDDPDLLVILPDFAKQLHTYDAGQRINMWWDHSPSILESYKAKFDGLVNNLLTLVGHRDTSGFEDTYLILLGDDNVFLVGPGRNILPLTSDEVSNVKVSQVVSRMNITHFNYVDLTTLPPIDYFIKQKQDSIQHAVVTAITKERRQLGLSQLIESSTLGEAALPIQEALMTIEEPQEEQIQSDFQQRAQFSGYQGAGVGVAYYRKAWPLDTCNEMIAQEVLGIILQTATGDYWEDWSIGLSRGFDPRIPTEFRICVVVGLGYSDGNALVTNYINSERVKADVQPLELDYHLRRLARRYLAMDTEPDRNLLSKDIEECGYTDGMSRFRSDYSGVYAPLPSDRGRLSLDEVARLVADEYLKTRRESLMRSDWQHVGFAVKLEPARPPMASAVPSVMSEYVVAWRLPPGAERPAHFPPPIDDPAQLGETPQ